MVSFHLIWAEVAPLGQSKQVLNLFKHLHTSNKVYLRGIYGSPQYVKDQKIWDLNNMFRF